MIASIIRPKRQGFKKKLTLITGIAALLLFPQTASVCLADPQALESLIREALNSNPDLAALKAKTSASRHRIPQANTMPDPMFMVGYENMGTRAYTYGDKDSKWMFTASQMFPFPGKLALKAEMAEKESESMKFDSLMADINLIQTIRGLYSDLSFSHKELEIVRGQKTLFEKIEETTLARYSSGMGMQQEVLMAQTEKYMLMETEEMLKAGISSLEAMLSGALGRKESEGIEKPADLEMKAFTLSQDEAIKKALDEYPEIKARTIMSEASKAKLSMAEKEYYPDFTLSVGYGLIGGDNEDMVNFSATANIPLFYRTKQREGVYEAKKILEQSRHEIEAAKVMIAAKIRDNYAMLKSSGNLATLYKNAIIPKSRQDFDQSLAAYSSGRTEASMTIDRLKKLMDSETALWKNLNEREKAIIRIEALAGIAVPDKYLKGDKAGSQP